MSREIYNQAVAEAVIRFGDVVVSASPNETRKQRRRREKQEAKALRKEERTRQAVTYVWTAYCADSNMTRDDAIEAVKVGFGLTTILMFLEPLLYPFLRSVAIWSWNRFTRTDAR